jgi:hypothetical protein
MAAALALLACSGGGGKPSKPTSVDDTGGSGAEETGGSSGSTGGSSGGAAKKDAAPASTGGSGGSETTADAAAGAGGSMTSDAAVTADVARGGDGAVVLGGSVLAFYEAEAVPPNTLISGAVVGKCGAATPVCPPPAEIKPETNCCSGAGEVRQLLRGKGGLQFNGVTVDADGNYDVTWWYHCGNNDNFHDPTCRGEPHTASGCRPGELTVNGTVLPKIYEFPCFPGSWGEIHAATTTVPLKAGNMNTIKMTAHYTNNDAIDIDAIAIYAAGKGVPPSLPKSQPAGQVAH